MDGEFTRANVGTELRQWQLQAVTNWNQSGRAGIVAAATGTGKTRVAVQLINEALQRGERVVVVVPKKVLAAQWVAELQTRLRLGPKKMGTLGGDNPSFQYEHRLVVAVINSARSRLSGIITHWQTQGDRVLLVVDECHWAGSEQSRTLFDTSADSTLGLSATPERGDDGFDEILVPNLGRVIFRYTLREALDDGLLAPLVALNVYLTMSPWERSEFDRISSELQRVLEGEGGSNVALDSSDPALPVLLHSLSGRPAHARLDRLMREQRQLLASSPARVEALGDLTRLGLFEGRRSLVFNETIDQAEAAHALLSQHDLAVVMDHSRLTNEQRNRAHRAFAAGAADCLVAVRTVDEGVDLPDADLAVITSGTTNPRQRIQRIGRVVRPKTKEALVVSLLAKGTPEELIGLGDEALLGTGRVHHLRTPQQVAAEIRRITASLTD